MNVMPSMHIETDSDWTWTRSIHAFQTCKGWQGGKGEKVVKETPYRCGNRKATDKAGA